MAIFGWKKSPDPTPSDEQPISFSPEKADRFFDHAKTVDETGNYEYAIQSWLSGLRQDPSSTRGVEGFFASIAKFLGEGDGKKGVSKEVAKVVGGKSELERYLSSLLDWGQKPSDPALAVKAFEGAARLNLREPAIWIGERALNWVAGAAKPRKDLLTKMADGFEKVGAFEKAVLAAEHASKLDPSDGDLAARVRSLAAQATMNRGGYSQAGQPGGFRANVRDQQKQRQLDEGERIVKTADVVERLLADAQEELARRPGDLPTIENYAKRLMERGKPDDEEKAHALYTQAFADTKQFRLRELAGDIRLRQAKRRASALKQAFDSGDAGVAAKLEQALRAHGDLEVAEFRLRVEAYPTDLVRKFELAKRLFHNDQFEDAIPFFQESQGDPRYRAPSLSMLAQCFLKLGWTDESIETFRRAADLRDLPAEAQMELNYGLMVALQAKATQEKDLAAAEEAEKLASSIAIRQITFRDVRTRRESLKKLVLALKAPPPAGEAPAEP